MPNAHRRNRNSTSFTRNYHAIYAWTDSQVTLAWLQGHPSRWKSFVANRVSEIQTTAPDVTWAHMASKDNPADVASRGISPSQLSSFELWWKGPKWLSQSSMFWPNTMPSQETNVDMEKRINVLVHITQAIVPWDLLLKYSSLTKLIRITSECRRFVNNLRRPHEERDCGPLSPGELTHNRLFWIRQTQASEFAEDIAALSSHQKLTRRSKLLRLTPFLDESGILRVGGRLQNAFLSYEEKHPAILPKRGQLSVLLIVEAHRNTLHGGLQLTLSYLLRRYWVLGVRSLIRSHIHNCVKCFRHRNQTTQQLMGNLPKFRITPARPFLRSGLDYAGPIQLRTSKGRGQRSYKGYIALFVRFATKAIHLEAVSDAPTQGFLAAYKRFTARRGICAELYSDNSPNFRGADAEMRSLLQAAQQDWEAAASLLANDGTAWKFIPPAAPHYGGLWEAAIKSTKTHLKKVIGNQTLTFEELSTVLAQIEAILNSRPLCPISSDATDLTSLTPGHFLIGTSLTAAPEPSLVDIPINRLSRWQLTQTTSQHFWRRWSTEYLHHLQPRNKWFTEADNMKLHQLVVIKDERLPPSKCLLGRIVDTHKGSDGKVRVVTIRTATSNLKRSINKVCPLPIEVNDNNHTIEQHTST